MTSGDAARLRDTFLGADVTLAGVTTRLGAAMRSAERGDFRAALAVAAGDDAQSVLIRLFVCGTVEPTAIVENALSPLSLSSAVDSGLILIDREECRAGLAVDLTDDGILLSDLPAHVTGSLGREHVLGVGGASATLRESIVTERVSSALDIGTGCGVQALRLSSIADHVTATDLSIRALDLAATNAALNGVEWELLAGDMLEPIGDRRFDRVVSNPPFVIGAGDVGYVYRDSGRAGDGVCAELAGTAARLLNPGGTLQFLANWLHVSGEDWRERVTGWFSGTGCDVWAIQRDVSDPLDYVRVWQRDAADRHNPERLAAWLDWFDAERVEGVGFGIITARKMDRDVPVLSAEDVRHSVEQPYRDRIRDWFAVTDQLSASDAAALLDSRPRLVDDVRLSQEATCDAGGWQVGRQTIVAGSGMRRVTEIDPLLVSFLGDCDGEKTVVSHARALAETHDGDAGLLAASLALAVRDLVRDGYLHLAE